MNRAIMFFALTFFSHMVWARTATLSEKLFAKRGTSPVYAKQAAEILHKKASEEKNKVERAKLLNEESHALYFFADKTTDEDKKIELHEQGMNVAKEAFSLIEGTAKSDSEKEVLATSYYFYGAHLGKWGETKGILTSLNRWPELREKMEAIISLGQAHVQDYGAYRILGRAYYKIPSLLGGDKDKSLEYLTKAFEGTKTPSGISSHGINNIFYAETLVAHGKENDAKSILSKFISLQPESLNELRLVETKDEQAWAKKVLEEL